MMTAYASISTAVEAMRKGAVDYIQKPFEADQMIMLVKKTLENQRIFKENEAYRTSGCPDQCDGVNLRRVGDRQRDVRPCHSCPKPTCQ